MNWRFPAASLVYLSLLSPAWCLTAREAVLKAPEFPPSCRLIAGVYPAGVHTSMIYDYRRYAGAMPSLIQKTAQSFSCNGVNGSLLFFEYASSADRDQAELFAKPILSREEDVADPVELVEWPTGFVIVSFKSVPAELKAALQKKLNPGSVSVAAPLAPTFAHRTVPLPTPLLPVSAIITHPTPTHVASQEPTHSLLPSASPLSVPTPKTLPPASLPEANAVTVLPSVVRPAIVSKPADEGITLSPSPGPVMNPMEPALPSLEQMAIPKPGAPSSAEPPMDTAHSINSAPSVPPPAMVSRNPLENSPSPKPKRVGPAVTPPSERIVTVAAMSTPPAVHVPTPYVPPAYVAPPLPVVPAPKRRVVELPQPVISKLPKPPTQTAPPPFVKPEAPVKFLNDVSDSVLANFADKMDCANPDLKEQGRMVCVLLDDFKSGEKGTLPQTSSEVLIGPVYTIDQYGRLTDRHHDVITGADYSGYLSFFSIVSASGQQDFEIQSIIDAKKVQKPLPMNATLQMIHTIAAKKRFPTVPTSGPSVVVLPGGPRRVFIRKTGDHWVLFGPQGSTADDQILSNVVLSELY